MLTAYSDERMDFILVLVLAGVIWQNQKSQEHVHTWKRCSAKNMKVYVSA